jgi:hypothetical protein
MAEQVLPAGGDVPAEEPIKFTFEEQASTHFN